MGVILEEKKSVRETSLHLSFAYGNIGFRDLT